MSAFNETSSPEKNREIEHPVMRETDIPHLAPNTDVIDNPFRASSDIFEAAFKKFGLLADTSEKKMSDTGDSSENKDYSNYLEEGDDGKYYDKETGKAYDSIEEWEKAQKTLAKRYDGASLYFEDKAKKEWARFKNAEQNGEPDDEKWEHYRRSQEYYTKSKECREKAVHIREKIGENMNSNQSDIVSEEKTDSNPSGLDDSAEKGNEVDTADTSEKGSPIQNKVDGLRREAEVRSELEEKYPPEDGYEIISEAYLRDKNGNIAKDPETGKARRIDYVVVKCGEVVDSIEVTSQTADKSDQLAKESRVRENGGNYVRDSSGNLIEMPSTVQTRIERRN